jgi:hypothetical protein
VVIVDLPTGPALSDKLGNYFELPRGGAPAAYAPAPAARVPAPPAPPAPRRPALGDDLSLEIAAHELGHCVAALQLPGGVEPVSIFVGRGEYGGEVRATYSDDWAELLVTCAGPAANWLRGDSMHGWSHHRADGDLHVAWDIIARLSDDSREQDRLWDRARQEARDLVEPWLHVIAALAPELARRGSMDPDEVRRAMGLPGGGRAGPRPAPAAVPRRPPARPTPRRDRRPAARVPSLADILWDVGARPNRFDRP